MNNPENPIEVIEQLKNDGFLVKENENKVRLALCGFGRLLEQLLSPEAIMALEKAEMYARGTLSDEDAQGVHQRLREYLNEKRPAVNWEAHGAILFALLGNLIEADYDDYMGYAVAFGRRADTTIPDTAYCEILRDVFSFEV